MTTTHQVICTDPPMVWVFTDENPRAVKELLGKEAEEFIAALPIAEIKPPQQ